MTYKGIPIRLSVDFFSAKTMQARRECVFKVMKGENLGPRMFCPARLLFRSDRDTKSFIDKQKLR